jgi:hypothetical protein
MTKSKLRKIAIVLSTLTVLSGGFGIDAAYARGGGFGGGHIGGFGGGHMGGFGGIHTGGIGADHIGSEFGGSHMGGGFDGIHTGGIGADHIGGEFGDGHMGGGGIANLRGNPLGTEHIGARTDNHVGALAGVYAAPFGQFRHRRTPAVVWGAAPWYNAYDAPWDSAPWYGGSGAPSYGGSGAPWYGGAGTPWDSGFDAPSYGGSGAPSDSGVENPTYALPGRDPSDTTNRNATCRTQTYQVRSAEDGGERAVNIVRC